MSTHDSKRPTTGMRLSTSMKRQGTAKATRLGTSRLTTARLSTSTRLGTSVAKGGPAVGTALTTQINVTSRPLTQHGLGGLKTASGRGRTVLDETYFLGELNNRITDLTTEINKIDQEATKLESEQGAFMAYNKKAEALAAEIKALHNELEDLNTANESINTNVTARELREEGESLQNRNNQDASHVDELFERRLEIDATIKKMEDEIDSIKNQSKKLVETLPPDERQRYEAMNADNEAYAKTVADQQAQLSGLETKIDHLEQELQQNLAKKQAVALHEQISALEARNAALKQQIEAEKQVSPEQLRQNLLEQVKSDNQEIAALERKIADVKQHLENLGEMDDEVVDDEDDPDEEPEVAEQKRKKYQELLKKEQEMNNFLSNYPDEYDNAVGRVQELESEVVSKLREISELMEKSGTLPSREQHDELKSDLSFKSTELEKSKQTTENLQKRRQDLAAHLHNVSQLETNIDRELERLKQDMEQMTNDVEKFKDLDGLQKSCEDRKVKMTKAKKHLASRAEIMSQTIKLIEDRVKKLQNGADQDDTLRQLKAQEHKWQHFEKNNFAVSEDIATRESQTNFQGDSQQVKKDLKAINKMLVEKIKSRPRAQKSISS